MTARRQGHLKEVAPGKWHVRVTAGQDAGGKRIRLNQTIHGSKADAQKYLNAAMRRKDDGAQVILTRQSLGAWIEEWLQVWCSGISARTKSDYDRLLRRYLPPELRARQLPVISASEIQGFVNNLESRGLAPRTIRMAHGALRTCLNRAVRVGKIQRNVATLVELPRNLHTERLYLTPEQGSRLLDGCSLEEWGAFFAVMLLTGVRPGEALGLQWKDVDGSVLRVRRALVQVCGKDPTLSGTKTGRSRVIPLGERALRVLREHRRRQAERRLSLGSAYENIDLLFPNEVGGFADLHNISSRHFKPLLINLGLPPIRLYDLRHSHATLLLAAGEHPKVVQERLGHSSILLTLDTYSHVVPAMQERATQRLDALLDDPCGVQSAADAM
jgi:integrase